MRKEYLYIIGLLLIISFIGYGFYSVGKNNKSGDNFFEKKITIKADNENVDIGDLDEVLSLTEGQVELFANKGANQAAQIFQVERDWHKLVNEKYQYSVEYPKDIYYFGGDVDSNLESKEDGYKVGGSIHWSNYADIDEITAENKPDDFWIMSMIIYQKAGVSDEDFMGYLDFYAEEVQVFEFPSVNVIGNQYISYGVDPQNPRVAVVFNENNKFYVFHLGFTNGREEVVKKMMAIISTFEKLDN